MSETTPSKVPVPRDTRERTVRALCAHFADDHLETAEFERRVDLAYQATSSAELEALVSDLPALSSPVGAAAAAAPAPAAATPSPGRQFGFVVAIMGGVGRQGKWVPAPHTIVTAVMGGAQLDFREAVLRPGVNQVTVIALMGGAEIIVPPGLAVETGGIAIMGGFEQVDNAPPGMDPSAPALKVNGLAVMGGVEISVRLPGETERDARKRLKEERRRRLT